MYSIVITEPGVGLGVITSKFFWATATIVKLIASSSVVSLYGLWFLTRPGSVIHFERGMDLKPDLTIIRSLFRFGLPTGVQGIAMNIAGVMLLRFIGSLQQSAAAQAAFADSNSTFSDQERKRRAEKRCLGRFIENSPVKRNL